HRDRQRHVGIFVDRRPRFFANRDGCHRGRMTSAATIAVVSLLLAVCASPLCAAEIAPDQRRSGFSFMAPGTQAMQKDDTANPGMLWVLDGEALWNRKEGATQKSCA